MYGTRRRAELHMALDAAALFSAAESARLESLRRANVAKSDGPQDGPADAVGSAFSNAFLEVTRRKLRERLLADDRTQPLYDPRDTAEIVNNTLSTVTGNSPDEYRAASVFHALLLAPLAELILKSCAAIAELTAHGEDPYDAKIAELDAILALLARYHGRTIEDLAADSAVQNELIRATTSYDDFMAASRLMIEALSAYYDPYSQATSIQISTLLGLRQDEAAAIRTLFEEPSKETADGIREVAKAHREAAAQLASEIWQHTGTD